MNLHLFYRRDKTPEQRGVVGTPPENPSESKENGEPASDPHRIAHRGLSRIGDVVRIDIDFRYRPDLEPRAVRCEFLPQPWTCHSLVIDCTSAPQPRLKLVNRLSLPDLMTATSVETLVDYVGAVLTTAEDMLLYLRFDPVLPATGFDIRPMDPNQSSMGAFSSFGPEAASFVNSIKANREALRNLDLFGTLVGLQAEVDVLKRLLARSLGEKGIVLPETLSTRSVFESTDGEKGKEERLEEENRFLSRALPLKTDFGRLANGYLSFTEGLETEKT